MIEGLQPYSEYKESGQEWLGQVPAHWSLLPNRALFEEVKDRDHPNEEMLSVTITRGIIRQEALLTDSSKKDNSNVNKGAYKLVQPGDIAYNKMRAWQGAVGASSFRGIISPAYVVMRPRKDCTPWYYHHLCRTPSFAKEAERWSYGITSDMWSLRPEHFKVIYSVQPPPDEQAAIVRFLEHANRKIDGFIRAKRKLIGLLNEQKQAIIHRAVTGQIDVRTGKPYPAYKPSLPAEASAKAGGIPWLGEIPRHWEALRLGRAINLVTGFPFKSEGFTHKESATRLLRGINVTPEGLRWDTTVRWERKQNDGLDPFALEIGDITLGMDRPIIASGVRAARVEVKDVPSLLLQRVARLRPTERLDGSFLLLLLRGKLFADYIAPIFTGISVPHLSPEQIRGFKVMLPPKSEQADIVRHVESETASLNTAITRTEREIALMQEYRTRLTADVVTGKLDVRPAAAKLPDITPDSTLEPATETPEESEADEVEA
jgi:type I restriction enzyme S subunit